MVKTGRVAQSRAQLCHWKIRDCSQSILKHDNKFKLTFAQLRSAFLKRILFCWKGPEIWEQKFKFKEWSEMPLFWNYRFSYKIVTPATHAKDMQTFLRFLNTFTHFCGILFLQSPVTAPSFHASTHFLTETPSFNSNVCCIWRCCGTPLVHGWCVRPVIVTTLWLLRLKFVNFPCLKVEVHKI